MNFKTGLIMRKNGQASIEYIILMAVLIGLLTIWLGSLFPNLRSSLEANFFNPAVEKIVSSDTGGSSPGPSEPPEPRPPPERN
jgi:uncharacterized protein (UPF0333 family)